jgi:hypothetical protein
LCLALWSFGSGAREQAQKIIDQADQIVYNKTGEQICMKKQFQITVSMDGNKVIVELPQDILRMLDHPADEDVGRGRTHNIRNVEQLTERELVVQKKPRGHAETVAVLAFYLRESGNAEFTADDVRRSYIRAGIRPPKVIAQALRDAKNKHDLIESGSKRSTFRLSPHGERTVLFDLPRSVERS